MIPSPTIHQATGKGCRPPRYRLIVTGHGRNQNPVSRLAPQRLGGVLEVSSDAQDTFPANEANPFPTGNIAVGRAEEYSNRLVSVNYVK